MIKNVNLNKIIMNTLSPIEHKIFLLLVSKYALNTKMSTTLFSIQVKKKMFDIKIIIILKESKKFDLIIEIFHTIFKS